MSGVIKQFVAERWRFGVLAAKTTLEDVIAFLNRRLGKLSETLERLHESIENGPLPGAYFPIVLYCDTPTLEDGIAITYTPNGAQGLKIISMTASLSTQSDSSADVDIDVKYLDPVTAAWTTILTATPCTPTVTTPIIRNAAGDFTAFFYSAKAFRVDCSDWTNIPKGLMVLLSCKNMGKIEPA